MTNQELDQYLRKENTIEYLQRKYGQNINDIKLEKEISNESLNKMPQAYFFDKGNIYIRKHHRYSKMVAHQHEFVELNYVYSGQCIQYINHQKIILKQGQILLMDKESIHSIEELGENDILINILIKDDSISSDILSHMVKSKSLVIDFLMNASKKENNHDHFLLFDSQNHIKINQFIIQMMCEFFEQDRYCHQTVKLLLSLLFIELIRLMEENMLEEARSQFEIVDILQYIDSHYENIHLQDLSDKFGYNKNYLSNKLKEETGYGFNELVDRKRLNVALQYLQYQDYTMEEIAYKIGYQSPSAFFKLFKKYYHLTPL